MSAIVVMGSGETAPTMVKEHRRVLDRSGAGSPEQRVVLDTTFGFQLNADDLVARTRQYFAEAVGAPVDVARWRRADAPDLEREAALAQLHRARWVFAGPGSPSYALRQWQGTPVPDALLDLLGRGGTLVLGSAAACTLGRYAVPVYEVYKAGFDPHWLPGLDLLGTVTGIGAAVVPHFDNAEGGHYDTRFCYLGAPRLERLEAELPDDVGIIGVDEHTSLVIDLTDGTVTAGGTGVVTLRHRGTGETLSAGETIPLDRMAAVLAGRAHHVGATAQVTTVGEAVAAEAPAATSLAGVTARCTAAFDRAHAVRDAEACVAAALELEQAIADWSTDTLQSDETGQARRALRAMVVRLGGMGADPAAVLAPWMEGLLTLRERARTGKDYPLADAIRDLIVDGGVELRDTPEGTVWSLQQR